MLVTMRSDGSHHRRISLNASGRATYRADGDLNLDGVDFKTPDAQLVVASYGAINTSSYLADADINRDGVVNGDDVVVMAGTSGEPAPLSGRVTQPSDHAGPDCVIGYAGYHRMLELGTYQVRFRVYDPELGRWYQRDPAGYVDGMSLYQYVRSGPKNSMDPFGLERECGSHVLVLTGKLCEDRAVVKEAQRAKDETTPIEGVELSIKFGRSKRGKGDERDAKSHVSGGIGIGGSTKTGFFGFVDGSVQWGGFGVDGDFAKSESGTSIKKSISLGLIDVGDDTYAVGLGFIKIILDKDAVDNFVTKVVDSMKNALLLGPRAGWCGDWDKLIPEEGSFVGDGGFKFFRAGDIYAQ